MRMLFALCVVLVSVNAYASEVSLVCTRSSSGDTVSDKKLYVSLNENEISFKATFFGKMKAVSGKFMKSASNGSLIYDGSELIDLVDQADRGNIFVAPQLLKGHSGKIDISIRQLGDSEGYNWIPENFSCVAR